MITIFASPAIGAIVVARSTGPTGPENISPPTISIGDCFGVGNSLYVNAGTWTGEPSLSYAWYVGGGYVADGISYQIANQDVGYTIQVVEIDSVSSDSIGSEFTATVQSNDSSAYLSVNNESIIYSGYTVNVPNMTTEVPVSFSGAGGSSLELNGSGYPGNSTYALGSNDNTFDFAVVAADGCNRNVLTVYVHVQDLGYVEVTNIICNADYAGSLHNRYFIISGAMGDYAMIMNAGEAAEVSELTVGYANIDDLHETTFTLYGNSYEVTFKLTRGDAAEVTQVTCLDCVGASLHNTYFTVYNYDGPQQILLNCGESTESFTYEFANCSLGSVRTGGPGLYVYFSDDVEYYFWFNTGSEAGPGAGTSIEVNISAEADSADGEGVFNQLLATAFAAAAAGAGLNVSTPSATAVTVGGYVNAPPMSPASEATMGTGAGAIGTYLTHGRTAATGGSGIIVVDIPADQDAATVASTISMYCNGFGWTVNYSNNICWFTDSVAGDRTDAVDGNSGFGVEVTTQGHTVDGAGVALLNISSCGSPADVAYAIQSAINASYGSYWSTSLNDVVLQITDAAVGPRTHLNPGNTGFSVETNTYGRSAVDNVGGFNNVTCDYTVDSASADIAAVVAARLTMEGQWTAYNSGDTVIVTDTNIGERTDAMDGTTGFGISVGTQGANPV